MVVFAAPVKVQHWATFILEIYRRQPRESSPSIAALGGSVADTCGRRPKAS
jgi:hypothetical protein